MKYCIDYRPNSRRIDEVDEINIPFNKDDMITLLNYLKNHTSQRINIYIENIDECLQYKIVEKMINLKKENPEINYALKFSMYNKDLPFDKMIKENIKFYFNVYISQWEDLLQMLDLGVSDIYITEDLGFELNKVKKVCENKVQIRAFPNVAQKSWDKIPDLKSFFIRPEDVEKYEPYIDVLEIYGDRKKHDILFKIYSKNKQWFGKLNEIITGFNSDLDSKFMTPRFADKRIRCSRECLKGGKCMICEHIEELSKNLEEAKIIIRIDKKEEKENG